MDRSEGQPFEGSVLTDAEVAVIHAALDLFSRVMTGQLEIVAEVLRDYTLAANPGPWSIEQHDALADAVRQAKSTLGLPRNGSLGIYNVEVHPAARLAYSLLRRMEGRDDDVARAIDAAVDGQWRFANGEPWYGRPARRRESE